MRRYPALALLVPALLTATLPTESRAQGASCADFDAWQWAQTVYESDRDRYAALDSDGDWDACPELTRDGFAPVLWADEIPRSAERVTVQSVTDGDTFDVMVSTDGRLETVRLYQVDTPETKDPNDPVECGGAEATDFLDFVLTAADGTLALEYDQTRTDRYDRRLAYAWFELGGDVYLVNEALIRNGFAEHKIYGDDRKYADHFTDAAAFAADHELGAVGLCGGFDTPLTEAPAAAQTDSKQPDRDSVPAVAVEERQQLAGGGCDPSYPGVCIPPAPPDLDCGDVGARRFAVVPPDPHGFDGDGDGVGCESG